MTGVNHAGTVINLFDYWIDTQDAPDNSADTVDRMTSGINADHALKFSKNGACSGTYNDWNRWVGDAIDRTVAAQPYQGIVSSTLGKNGYPYLSTAVTESAESLDYLFDPSYAGDTAYRETHRNVSSLLQIDEHGYYYYDSTQNYAEYDGENNSFILYDGKGVSHGGAAVTDGQFFPFNSYEAVKDLVSTNPALNHYFGMTLVTRFVQRYDGHTSAGGDEHTTFEFAGDDDVWIFVDGVLVADLGGIHDRATVKIDFATGEVIINEGKTYAETTTLYQAFVDAGKEDTVEWSEDEDDDGDPVPGAEFSVYQANAYYKIINDEPVYTGDTDANGQMTFQDEDGMPYTMNELRTMFGEYFVVEETKVPKGYRLVSEEIHLRITGDVLLCDNTWESGVWADANVLMTVPNTVKLTNGGQKTL